MPVLLLVIIPFWNSKIVKNSLFEAAFDVAVDTKLAINLSL